MAAPRIGIAQHAVIVLIQLYRRHLSHLKGYRCAWGIATGRDSCSGVGLRAFRRVGFVAGLLLLRRQFDRCALARYRVTTAPQAAGSYRRLVPAGQRGDCDCGAFDCTPDRGCDITDLPSFCNAGCCDFPCDRRDNESRAARARIRAREREERRRRRALEHR
jgi:putative component of membrane protein insertase Oxa1/YidC/SpoIIIJ protein YidD